MWLKTDVKTNTFTVDLTYKAVVGIIIITATIIVVIIILYLVVVKFKNNTRYFKISLKKKTMTLFSRTKNICTMKHNQNVRDSEI